jgi:hypothetical protein
MLNKKICLKCFDKHQRSPNHDELITLKGFNDWWRSEICLCATLNESWSIHGPPPKQCPYELEQLVSDQNPEQSMKDKLYSWCRKTWGKAC